jgi:voltage-gated potassium channel
MVLDSSGQNSLSGADERTILACFTLKSLNPDAIISVEILKSENEQHLRRAGVENIVVNGEFSGFLLSASTSANGIPQAVRELLSWSSPSRFRQVPIPPTLVGKCFMDAVEWFIHNNKGILVGVLSEEKQVSLEDLVSDDSSAIDAFIKRKFQEADIDLAGETKGSSEIKLNPGPAYVLRDHDLGFVVG